MTDKNLSTMQHLVCHVLQVRTSWCECPWPWILITTTLIWTGTLTSIFVRWVTYPIHIYGSYFVQISQKPVHLMFVYNWQCPLQWLGIDLWIWIMSTHKTFCDIKQFKNYKLVKKHNQTVMQPLNSVCVVCSHLMLNCSLLYVTGMELRRLLCMKILFSSPPFLMKSCSKQRSIMCQQTSGSHFTCMPCSWVRFLQLLSLHNISFI